MKKFCDFIEKSTNMFTHSIIETFSHKDIYLISDEMRKIMSNYEDHMKVKSVVNYLKRSGNKNSKVKLSYRDITISIK